MASDSGKSFADESGRKRSSLVAEMWLFLRTNRRLWMLPIFVVFAFFGLLLLAGGTAAAPFIYSLF